MLRIRQIVLASEALAAGRALLKDTLFLTEPFRDPGVAEFGIDNAVFVFGDQFIEVISPFRPDTACGRHLQRSGDGAYMVLLQTDDFAREKSRWDDLNVRTVWNFSASDITAAHLHPKDIGGAIVSVDEPRPSPSWRWGGPDWRVQPGAPGRQRVRGIALGCADAKATALRWAQVLGLPAPTRRGDAWRLILDEGFVDFEASESGRTGISGYTLTVADPAAVLAAARAAGLPQSGKYIQLLGTRWCIESLDEGSN